MRLDAAKSAAILALAVSFLLGILVGITVDRPLSQVIPKRADPRGDSPDERVVQIQSGLVDQLTLDAAQKEVIDEIILEMVTTIREAQLEFHPTITRAMVTAIDAMLPHLDDDQRSILERRRENILRNEYNGGPPPNAAGFGPQGGRGFGPPSGGNFGPPNGAGFGPPNGQNGAGFGPPGGGGFGPPNGQGGQGFGPPNGGFTPRGNQVPEERQGSLPIEPNEEQ